MICLYSNNVGFFSLTQSLYMLYYMSEQLPKSNKKITERGKTDMVYLKEIFIFYYKYTT